MSRIPALVEPELLRWARRSAGFQLGEAAHKIRVKPERLESWERNEAKPTFNQLRKIANVYKRPISVFYLAKPPKDFKPLKHDFRRMPGAVAKAKSPELIYEIRRAHARREVALDMYASAGLMPPVFEIQAELSEDAELVGERIRKTIAPDLPSNWSSTSPHHPFNYWRERLEGAGVLVFQAERVDPKEMAGFSISEQPSPVIVANVKDTPRRRTFTMLHEVAHLMLREAGICDLEERRNSKRPEENRIEIFCNRVAGAVLVPRRRLIAESLVAKKTKGHQWSAADLRVLANRYGVSREVILRRLTIFDLASQAYYENMCARFEQEYRRQAEGSEGGFAPPYRVALSTAGALYTRLVLANYYRDAITASDVSDFLGVRLKHLPKIEAELFATK